jgi:hypothetical protein
MKLIQRFGNGLIGWVGLAVMAGASTLSAADEIQGSGTVSKVVGQPTYSRAGGAWEPLKKSMVLRAGDVIKTDGQSTVDVGLGANNGEIRVLQASEMAFDKLTYKKTGLETIHDTQLNLRAGTLCGNVHKMPAGAKYEVKTPRGVAGIRGTKYRISANGDCVAIGGTVVQSLLQQDGVTIKTFTVQDGQALMAAGGEVRNATPQELQDLGGNIPSPTPTTGAVTPTTPPTEPFVSPVAPQ